MAMSTLTDLPTARRGLLRRWTGPMLRVGPDAGSLFDAVLEARGWTERRETWFAPKIGFHELDAPYERDDYLAAAEVILAAIAAGKRLAIYGDYDADGLTATAILFHAIRALEPGLTPRCYIPHRRDEGYGLHREALHRLRSEGIDLVVTVDCGIGAIEEVAEARAAGLSIVVTDHHAPRSDGRLPDADAIVHPALPDREHRCAECCGAMIAWKLAWTLFVRREGSPTDRKLPARLRETLTGLASLAAIGTVADVMPLVGENRELVRFGLQSSGKTGIPGLDALWRFGDIARDGITSEAIAFRLAPRLNAAGRMGSTEEVLRLLTVEDDPKRCAEIVRRLDKTNTERKEQESLAFRQAREELKGKRRSASIVLGREDWNSGLIGIVCSRLLEEHGCPVLLFAVSREGRCHLMKGSGRAPPGFPLLEAIEAAIGASGIRPKKYGGHAGAAGMTLGSRADFNKFRRAFEVEAKRRRPDKDAGPELTVDLEFPPDTAPAWLSMDAVRELERIGPFGRGNPRPAMLLREVRFSSPPKVIGGKGNHLSVHLRIGETDDPSSFLPAVWWNSADRAGRIVPGRRRDVVVIPRVDRFLGEAKVMLEIVDLSLD